MIVGLMERSEGFISEVRDVARVATRIDTIDMFGEEGVDNPGFEYSIRGRIRAFHLVEDHAFVGERFGWIVELIVPALLHERLFRNQWMKDGIHVDVDQVIEILNILAGNGIAGL